MFGSLPRTVLRAICRVVPQERGKFRILNELYFGGVAPKQVLWVTDTLRYNLRMRLNIAEFLQAHLYLFGSYELPTVRFIRSYLRTGDVAIDIGAQIGYLTLIMATSAGGATHVLSFEPEAVNIQRFQENILLNSISNVQLFPMAVSNFSGTLKLYLSTDHNSGTHSTIANDPNVGSAFEEVATTTIDAVVANNAIEAIRLIKIDVEGAELEVVQGAVQTMQSLHPTFIIELSEKIQVSRNFSTTKFKSMMASSGYDAYTISNSGKLVPSLPETTHMMDNLVFVHSKRANEIAHLIVAHRA